VFSCLDWGRDLLRSLYFFCFFHGLKVVYFPKFKRVLLSLWWALSAKLLRSRSTAEVFVILPVDKKVGHHNWFDFHCYLSLYDPNVFLDLSVLRLKEVSIFYRQSSPAQSPRICSQDISFPQIRTYAGRLYCGLTYAKIYSLFRSYALLLLFHGSKGFCPRGSYWWHQVSFGTHIEAWGNYSAFLDWRGDGWALSAYKCYFWSYSVRLGDHSGLNTLTWINFMIWFWALYFIFTFSRAIQFWINIRYRPSTIHPVL
jgi:hypothetical protein